MQRSLSATVPRTPASSRGSSRPAPGSWRSAHLAIDRSTGLRLGQACRLTAAAALALARVLDNPKAVSSQPAAAKVLAVLLDKLRSASARGRRGHLTVVRTKTEKGSA